MEISEAKSPQLGFPALRDAAGEYRAAYVADAGSAYLIRPDGYIGDQAAPADSVGPLRYLATIFA